MKDMYGLRPSAAAVCPRVVAGKRCLLANRDTCSCRQHSRMLDHARMWLDEAGRHVMTAEPYEADAADLVAFVLDVQVQLELAVTITGTSPWNPGATYLLLVRSPR